MAQMTCESGPAGVGMKATVVISTKARQIMSKRLVLKLTVMVAAVSAMTLLQGCDSDNDGVTVAGAWMPVGSGTLPVFIFGSAAGGGMGGVGGQNAMGATAGAVAAGAGGGGGQVSTGGAAF
jgi:hypothetical protein